MLDKSLLNILKDDINNPKQGLYYHTQILFSYHSNKIEGSKLSLQDVENLFNNGFDLNHINVDVKEAYNHFKCFNYILENVDKPISHALIKKLHEILKTPINNEICDEEIGQYKTKQNYVGDTLTSSPKDVRKNLTNLIDAYNNKDNITLEDIIDFHVRFENIHPFQDGNGRVGRLIMFKECLKHNIVPFIIEYDIKNFYYRGLKEYKYQKGYLLDTILYMQDKYQNYLDYFLNK